jgi:hypothetical protein
MDAARCYNARRRYSHNVPIEYAPRHNSYERRRSRYVVTELSCSCCKDKFKGLTEHIQHCRTAVHIATMYGVDRVELLRIARRLGVLEALERA